jgi:uncharacterized protein (DUF1697 family)
MKNEKLRGVFERLGFGDVRSVISSGNILFVADETGDPAAREAEIEAALHEDLGITSTTILRSRDDLQALVDCDPFPGLTHGTETYLTATFLQHREAMPAVAPELPAGSLSEIVHLDGPAAAVCAITDNSRQGTTPDLMARLEKALGPDITTRTWKTVERILAKL